MKKTNKIKTIQIVQHLSPGGLEVMALNLLDASSDARQQLIVSLDDTKENALKKWPRLQEYKKNIIFLNKSSGICLKVFAKIIWLFLKHKPNVIHTHHIGPLFYAGLVGKFLGFKNITHTEHDAWYLDHFKTQKLQNFLIKVIKPKVVAVSGLVAEKLKEKTRDTKINIIPNGINIENFKPFPQKLSRKFLNLPLDKIIIGSAGRLVEVKGHKYLIQSLQNLKPSIHLAIAGNGELKEDLMSLTKKLNLEDRVHFLGHTDDMSLFYNALDVFCLPSLNEGLPLTLLEAQACDTPCVSSNVGGCHEVISKKSGVLTQAQNIEDLSQKLKNTISSLTQFKPREFVTEYGDLYKMAQSYHNLYQLNQK